MKNHIGNPSLRSFVLPFLLALGGIISDYVSTSIGLNMGLYETNPQYHPVWALLYFWGIMAMFTLLLPRKKIRLLSLYGLATTSYLGIINNILVILGMFPGIQIQLFGF